MTSEAAAALAHYRAISEDASRPERTRSAAASVAVAIEACENVIAREARPESGGHSLLKPRGPS